MNKNYSNQFIPLGLLLILILHTVLACTPSQPSYTHYIATDSTHQLIYSLTAEIAAGQRAASYQLSSTGALNRAVLAMTDRHAIPQLNGAQITGMVWDGLYNRLIVADAVTQNLYWLDPLTQESSVLSGATRGDGPLFGDIGDLVLDVDKHRLIVIDNVADAAGVQRMLTSVDLTSGSREVLASESVGVGPLIAGKALTYDVTQNKFYILYATGVVEVDGYTGNRRRFSDASAEIGLGEDWLQVDTIDFDYLGHRLLLTDGIAQQVVSIDLASGDRSAVTHWQEAAEHGHHWGGSALLLEDALYIANQRGQEVLSIPLAEPNCRNAVQTAATAESCQTLPVAQVNSAPVEQDQACTVLAITAAHGAVIEFYAGNPWLPIIYPFAYPITLWLSIGIITGNPGYNITCKRDPFFGLLQIGWILGFFPILGLISLGILDPDMIMHGIGL